MIASTVLNAFKISRTRLFPSLLISDCGKTEFIFPFKMHYKLGLIRLFNTGYCLESMKKFTKEEGKLVKRDGTVLRLKTNSAERVTLINNKRETMVMSLLEAQQLADSKGLHLFKLRQNKKQKMDFYKMLTDKELAKSNDAKFKQYILKSRIADHDFNYKMKNILTSLDRRGSVQLNLKFSEQNLKTEEEFLRRIREHLDKFHSEVILINDRSGPKFKSFILKKIDEVDGNSKVQEKQTEKENSNGKWLPVDV